jgi:hypothetical protein
MTTLREAAQAALDMLTAPFVRSEEWVACRDALRAALAATALEPVGWLDAPHGAFRANPAFRLSGPQSLNWSLPVYLAAPAQRQPPVPLESEQIENCIDEANRNFNRYRSSGPCGQMVTEKDDWKYWLVWSVERAHGIGIHPTPPAGERLP